MDLVLDIGNSAAKAGFFTKGVLHRTTRLPLAPATARRADWQRVLHDALKDDALEDDPHRAGLASVVPVATARARSALRALCQLDAFSVSAAGEAPLPFALAYRTPATLGADRLAAAAAAWSRYGTDRSVIALDAGTALTYDVVRAGAVGSDGVYEGGAIAPGPALLQNALTDGTAQLPSVPLVLPPTPVGATTREALQSGLLYGLLDGAAGMVHRLSAALHPSSPVVVSTGGWGAFLHARLDCIAHHDPHLVLRGVSTLMRLDAGEAVKRR